MLTTSLNVSPSSRPADEPRRPHLLGPVGGGSTRQAALVTLVLLPVCMPDWCRSPGRWGDGCHRPPAWQSAVTEEGYLGQDTVPAGFHLAARRASAARVGDNVPIEHPLRGGRVA